MTANEDNQQKQGGGMDTTDTEREGYSADELGQASIYDDPTQIAQQMRRGDESQGDPNTRDHVGATDFKDWSDAREDKDTMKHADVPRAEASPAEADSAKTNRPE